MWLSCELQWFIPGSTLVTLPDRERMCEQRYPVTSTSIQLLALSLWTIPFVSCQRSCFLRYLGWQESWSPGQYLRLKNIGGPVFRPGPGSHVRSDLSTYSSDTMRPWMIQGPRSWTGSPGHSRNYIYFLGQSCDWDVFMGGKYFRVAAATCTSNWTSNSWRRGSLSWQYSFVSDRRTDNITEW